MNADELRASGFAELQIEHQGKQRPVFQIGRGPGVLLMHELAGIGQPIAEFARFLAGSGFTVWMPYLFNGREGGTERLDRWWPGIRACLTREFILLVVAKTSPITVWLRVLARRLHESVGGPGVGVIGMCMSGGFALATALEPSVTASVASQPSLPLAIRPSAWRDVGVEPCGLGSLRYRLDREQLRALALRFSADVVSPAPRFRRLQDVLGGRLSIIEIPSGRGTPFRWSAHSVLTEERTRHPKGAARLQLDEVRDEVLQFLRTELGGSD